MLSLRNVLRGGQGRTVALALLALLLLIPNMAFASGGENVALEFSGTDKILLFISLGIGLVALFFAWLLGSSVLRQSPGDEKMQAVGDAVRQGALAYLAQQRTTILIFVVILAVGLFLLYQGTFGVAIGIAIAGAFVLGVLASYLAGYTGMLMAVRANTRTAAAALTSYKRALEVAFHAGGVAGLVTVGMGLVGATLIFLIFAADAMKILVGFGFGGSLAALFMRVGGGIYTKAADVGADLVGKVEAGIPEDDPRNPATIADNVGDNVGDCAGMAADVFESYEVTLVAAIVLGAATAALFDTATWMRLVLFALMARGVGIIASIIGIYMVKGTDDIDADPLKLIRRGFYSSAGIAAVITAVLAFVMMGGLPNMSPEIKTSQVTSSATVERAEIEQIQKVRDDVARWMNQILQARNEVAKQKNLTDVKQVTVADLQANPLVKQLAFDRPERKETLERIIGMAQDAVIEPSQLTLPDLQKNPEIKKMGLDTESSAPTLQRAIVQDLETMPAGKKLEGYAVLDPNGKNEALSKYSIQEPYDMTGTPPSQPKYISLGDYLKSYDLRVYDLTIKTKQPAPPTERGQTSPEPETRTIDIKFGPIHKAFAEKLFDRERERGKSTGMEIVEKGSYPVKYLINKKGEIIAGIASNDLPVHRVQGAGQGMQYWTKSPEEMAKFAGQQFSPDMPQPKFIQTARLASNDVPWWKFLVCILFGIVMAFIFEMLTDYYVSTHKAPVREVADVSTTGPAPMIIQGMAYGKESSVFSLLAIVISLIVPLLVFAPSEYGGYLLSFYGIALVGLGLLTTTGFILAMDSFGPISDNAQGVFEMSGAGHDNKNAFIAIQRLDAAGNTTKALTKGFAIATAVVAATALFHSYVESAKLTAVGMPLEVPEIFLGLLIGGAAPFLFCAFMINAVGRSAFQLINEVRRQFREDPGILAGTSTPDYGRCVAIVTSAAQKELLGPGILAVALPVVVAFGFAIGKPSVMIGGQAYNLVGAQALGGFLAGTILSGQLLAVMLANAGGLWDNSKKLIEDGLHGGKGTEAHKAAVVCDTVGDPFKDTAGPALNPLIKVMNLVALLLAPYVIAPYPMAVTVTVTVVGIAALVVAFVWSKRESLSTGLSSMQGEAALPPSEVAMTGDKTVHGDKVEKKD